MLLLDRPGIEAEPILEAHTASLWSVARRLDARWLRVCAAGVPPLQRFQEALWSDVLGNYLITVEGTPVAAVGIHRVDLVSGTAWIDAVPVEGRELETRWEEVEDSLLRAVLSAWNFRRLLSEHLDHTAPAFSRFTPVGRLQADTRCDGELRDRVIAMVSRDEVRRFAGDDQLVR